mgnify:CR=1 FL=1|tara:strand:+ start:48363 stop:49703 length:1341 start_codon:yes stop_codon:yes gene_type:complete
MGRTRHRKKGPPQGLFEANIETMSHDGRGIARIEGKTTFIDNALPGEQVRFRYNFQRRKFDEGSAEEITLANEHRAEPPCAHSFLCGGCSLQHLSTDEQIVRKQHTLAEQLEHFGGIVPEQWLEPLTGPVVGYRSRARLGAKYVYTREQMMVGFREKRHKYLADISRCEVLRAPLGESLEPLSELIASLVIRGSIPQVEIAAGDSDIALIFRHLDPLGEGDEAKLEAFCAERGWHCYLQPGNESTMHRILPSEGPERLYYAHPDVGITLAFHPRDFTQVNSEINRKMVPLALDLLDIEPSHRMLDLFCGLGNFTLPAALRAAHVVGVEGGKEMVERGYENARANNIDNVEFHAWDLTQPVKGQSWAAQKFDRILIDPPRTGALEVIPQIAKLGAKKLVYVSCNPATLARDAGELLKAGYRLTQAGVMDMFPHTTHVESIALFERRK